LKLALETPILFLIFNRPDTTYKVFESIAQQQPSKLYIAADGPRSSKVGEDLLCQNTRKIVSKIDWPCEVKTLFRDQNLGCRQAISGAIDWFFDHEEEGIILEDDCLPHPDFYRFCVSMLERYRQEERVMHITGDNFQGGLKHGNASYYFSGYAHIWGWATWKRAWRLYNVNMTYEEASEIIDKHFKNYFEKKYWKIVAQKVKSGEFNTWDYQWAFTLWKYNGLAIIPNNNLVSNIGFGESSTHLVDENHIFSNLKFSPLGELTFNDEIKINEKADQITNKRMFIPPLGKIIWNKIKKLLKIR
jgi:hypothetical protein